MKERMFSRMFQRAVGRCETVLKGKTTASGAGFVKETGASVMKPGRPVIGLGLDGV